MKSKMEIAALAKKQRGITKNGLATQYNNTRACFAYYNGEPQNLNTQIQFMTDKGEKKRATVNFNKVQGNVDVVGGFMAQNRRQAKYVARITSSEEQETYSSNMNSLYGYHRENENADQVESDQDIDMLVCGYGATETDLSYIIGNATNAPGGEVLKMKLDTECVGWDPKARARNLLDGRWAFYHDDFDLKDALSLFDDSTPEDFEQVDGDDYGHDNGYRFNPWGGKYNQIKDLDTVEWADKSEDMVRVYNHQWFEYETYYRARNPVYDAQTPADAMYYKARLDVIAAEMGNDDGPEGVESRDMFSLDSTAQELVFDEQTKNRLVQDFGNLIQPIAFKRKVFYTAVLSGDHVFTAFKSICQQGFSIKFKTGSYNKTGGFWIGMVNAMMEPARYYNKALTELMFTIAANSKGGVMVETTAVEDIADFSTKWAKTDAVITVADGALAAGRIQEKVRGAVPTGLESIITLSEASISAAGVDPAMMGSIDKEDNSGILYKRRIRQVISKMAKYFDSIDLYQKEDARLHADLIPIWVQNNVGHFVRITGDDGADTFLAITEDMLAAEYDVSIQEAPQSPEDKQETAVLLGQFGDKIMAVNPAAAQAFYAESLQMIPLDGSTRNRLTQLLVPDQQMIPAAQAQQQIQQLQGIIEQLQSQLTQAEVKRVESETLKNNATAQKSAADAAKTLEEAANQGLENDLIRSGNYMGARVNI